MPSESRSVRELQKKRFEESIAKRRATLEEKGLSAADIQKDPKIKQIKAKLRQLDRAVEAIDAKAKLNEKLAQRKKEKAEKPPEEKKKGKRKEKKMEAEAQPSGKKAKKQKKK